MMKGITIACALIAAAALLPVHATDNQDVHALETIAPDAALERLKQGNQRFREGKLTHLHATEARRQETSTAQHPFAAILSCSDSRAIPEFTFDTGIGDLFVVRVAGNIAEDAERGSLEYAVNHLGVPLVVVKGHTSCGAVTAAVKDVREKDTSLSDVLNPIKLSVLEQKATHRQIDEKDLIDVCIRANVLSNMQSLIELSPSIRAAVKGGKLKLVGAVYNLKSGEIEWLGEHPRQHELLK